MITGKCICFRNSKGIEQNYLCLLSAKNEEMIEEHCYSMASVVSANLVNFVIISEIIPTNS